MQKWIGESVSDMINNKEKPFLLEKDDYKALVMDHPQIKDFSRVYDSDGSMFETYWVFTESTHGRPGGMKLTGGYNIFKKKLTDQLGSWSSDVVIKQSSCIRELTLHTRRIYYSN